MTDLSDFGAGVETRSGDDESTGGGYASDRKYQTGRCRAIDRNGQRCSGPCESAADFCHSHGMEADPVTIDDGPIRLIEATSRTIWRDFEGLDVDHERIRSVLHNLVGLEDKPLTISDDGVWLPERHAEASQLILRTPTATVDSRLSGDTRKRVFPTADAGHYDEDYLAGEGRTAKIRNDECLPDEDDEPYKIGLKIAGEDQQWFPLDIVDGGGC